MNRVQSRWLGVPYIGSPVGSVWLGTWRMRDLGGSWTRMISMLFLLFSNMVFIRVLFFLTFCENIFRVSLIIVSYHLRLGELSWPWFPRLPVLFLNANLCWISFSRRGIYSRQLCVHLCNWCIWRNENKAGLGQFQVRGGLIWDWLCSTMLALCDVRVCVGHYTFGIENHELCMKRLNSPIFSNYGTGGR